MEINPQYYLIFILMKISFPPKEVYPNFTSVILNGPWGCSEAARGVGGWRVTTPRTVAPPPRGIDTSFELVSMATANGAGRCTTHSDLLAFLLCFHLNIFLQLEYESYYSISIEGGFTYVVLGCGGF